jgi:hypothetical protein
MNVPLCLDDDPGGDAISRKLITSGRMVDDPVVNTEVGKSDISIIHNPF